MKINKAVNISKQLCKSIHVTASVFLRSNMYMSDRDRLIKKVTE